MKSLNRNNISVFLSSLLLLVLAVLFNLFVKRIKNIKLPDINDREIIFWLIEIN